MIIQFLNIRKNKNHSKIIQSIENNLNISNINNLTEDEKKVYLILKKNRGVMYQRDIVIETKFPPYKVSRIISHFTIEGIVNTEKYGMTKKIVLVKKIM